MRFFLVGLAPTVDSQNLLWFWFPFLLVLSLAPVATAEEKQPNIILIVADDLGWTDLGCFGSKYYRTPNLDKLRKQGMQFTNAYTAGPNCAPTRACLMSGLYSPRHGVYTVGSGARGREKFRKLIPAPNNTTLAPSFVTVAELLKAAGYVTAHFGKWHLGSPGKAGPKEQGFDENYGGNHSGSPRGGYFSPYRNPQLPNGPKGENLTDRLSADAVKFIQKHQKQPFFMYMAYYAVHTPIQAKADLTAKYEKRKANKYHNNPKYAAMIETMDTGIGRILDTLDELKLADDTIVIFYSDNGGVGGYRMAGVIAGEITSQFPLRGGKGMLYEGGVRVPMIVRWPKHTPPNSTNDTPIISVDFLPTLAEIGKTKKPKRTDGVSLVNLFKSPKAKLPRDTLYWHFPGYLQGNQKKGAWRTTPAGSIRKGHWKLLEFFETGRLELYNLKDDISQKKDLAKTNPARRDELHKLLVQWRKDTKAPMPQPKKRKRQSNNNDATPQVRPSALLRTTKFLGRSVLTTNLPGILTRANKATVLEETKS